MFEQIEFATRKLQLTIQLFCIFGVLFFSTSDTFAQQVSAQLSTREGYVGSPILLQINITNATDYSLPNDFKIDGCDVEAAGAPATASQVVIFNGQRSETRSVTMKYLITPRRAGKFTIPELKISIDGETTTTNETNFVATKSETGDLMFVEIEGKKSKVFVGQPLELTLKIWVKPFKDKESNIKLSEANMWQMVSENSNWGSFASPLQELASQRQRPGGKSVLRDDGSGLQSEYYLYEVDATVYPTKPGKIDADEVQIVVEYPEKLGRSRDPFDSLLDGSQMRGSSLMKRMMDDDFFGNSPFGRRVSISKSRPIAANATVDSTEVVPVPTEGRPDDYRGAVGRYSILTEAEQKSVDAGDPIPIRIGIIGDGPMDLVQAPPLSEIGSLTDDFKVTDQSLAGFVQDDTKVFVTTVRPRSADVSQIPPIPFSFFDPETESFETVYSKPIPISVSEAETLALDSIVGNANSANEDAAGSAMPSIPAVPKFENDFSMDVLSSTPTGNRSAWQIWIIVPFSVWLIALIAKAGFAISRFLPSLKSVKDQTIDRLNSAASVEEIEAVFVNQIQEYSRQQFPSSKHAIGWLRSNGLSTHAKELESFLAELGRENELPVAVESIRGLEENERGLLQRGQKIACDLDDANRQLSQRRKRHVSSQKRSSRFRNSTASLVLIAIAGPAAFGDEHNFAESSLTLEQQKQILTDANEIFKIATEQISSDAAESADMFARAATKYRTLIRSGIQNEKVYLNLGNALWRSNQKGKAIAAFRQALRCNPASDKALESLIYCRSQRTNDSGTMSIDGLGADFNPWLQWPFRFFGRRTIVTVLAVCSTAFWLLATIKVFRKSFPFWRSALLPAVLMLFCGTLLWADQKLDVPVAVCVVDTLNLRDGDGIEFQTIAKIDSAIGKEFQFHDQRTNWVKISTSDELAGWVPAATVEVIGAH